MNHRPVVLAIVITAACMVSVAWWSLRHGADEGNSPDRPSMARGTSGEARREQPPRGQQEVAGSRAPEAREGTLGDGRLSFDVSRGLSTREREIVNRVTRPPDMAEPGGTKAARETLIVTSATGDGLEMTLVSATAADTRSMSFHGVWTDGQVMNQGEFPVEGATVEWTWCDQGLAPRASTTTSAAGRFSVLTCGAGGAQGERPKLVVRRPGYADWTGELAADGQVLLVAAGVVRGRCADEGGAPLEGVVVLPAFGDGETRTDASGDFELTGLDCDEPTTIAFVTPKGHVHVVEGVRATYPDGSDLGSVRFGPVVSVRGRLVGVDGVPIGNVAVSSGLYIWHPSGEAGHERGRPIDLGKVVTDGAGEFVVAAEPGTALELDVTDPADPVVSRTWKVSIGETREVVLALYGRSVRFTSTDNPSSPAQDRDVHVQIGPSGSAAGTMNSTCSLRELSRRWFRFDEPVDTVDVSVAVSVPRKDGWGTERGMCFERTAVRLFPDKETVVELSDSVTEYLRLHDQNGATERKPGK